MNEVAILSTGHVRQKSGDRGVRRYLRDHWRDDALPIHVALIDHPQGLCLLDTGQAAAAARPGYFPWWQPFFRLARFELESEDEAVAQLARRGVSPSDVRWVVLSHLHTDHVGGLSAFRQAEVFVSAVEWDRARGLGGHLRGYLPDRWPGSLVPTRVTYGAGRLGPFRDSFDLAGDGSLMLVPLPGHTPGHMALIVRRGDRPTLLAGDAAFTAAGFASAEPEISEWSAREGIEVVLTHDPAVPLD